MGRKSYGHRIGRDGRPVVVETTLPRHLRGYDPDIDAHTFTEGPIKRLLSRKGRH